MRKLIIFFILCIIANFSYAQDLAQITNVHDFNDFKWQGNGDLQGDNNLCIVSDTGRYSVNIQGSNGGFFLKDAYSNPIPFTVKWNDSPTSNNATTVSHNITLTGQTGAKPSADDCLSSDNANLSIIFSEENLNSMPAGNYTGYLTIMIEAIY